MQQQPWQPPTGPVPPQRKSNTGLKAAGIAGLGCGGILVILTVLAIIGAIGQATGLIKPEPTHTPAAAASPSPSAVKTTAPAAKTAAPPPKPPVKATATPTKTANEKPPSASSCEPGPDLIYWSIAPGATSLASALGSYDSAECRREGRQSTLDQLQQTSPTGDGYCTLVAWASDNPGYEEQYIYGATAQGAPRPKHVILSVGSC